MENGKMSGWLDHNRARVARAGKRGMGLGLIALLILGLLGMSAVPARAQECQNQAVIDTYLFGCTATGAVCQATCNGLTTACDGLCGAAEATCKGACRVTGKTCEILCDVGNEVICQAGCAAEDTACRGRCAGKCTVDCALKCVIPWSDACKSCVRSCSSSCNGACTSALRSCSAACTSNPNCNACLDCQSDCKLACDNCWDLECENCQLDCEANAPECVPFKQIGEECWPDPGGLWLGKCAPDLSCSPVVVGHDFDDDTLELSNLSLELQCVPPQSDTVYPPELCKAIYNPLFHEAWSTIGLGLAKTWGVGANETLGVSLTGEAGVVYGQECYGCYHSFCSGFSTNVAVSAYQNSGFYIDFDSVAGQSWAVVAAAGIPVPGEFIEVSGAWVFSQETSEYIGVEVAGGVTAGLLPVEGGVIWCDTVVQRTCCIDRDAEFGILGRCVEVDDGGGGGGGNAPPVALCDDRDECAPAGGCYADLEVGPDSYDPEGGLVSRVQTPPAPYGIGQHAVLLRVTDPEGLSNQCTASVRVRDCEPPSITCPPPVSAECQGNEQATVDPGDAVASDICSTPSVTDPGPTAYNLGTTVVTYTATDGAGNQASCDTAVTVQDTTPPGIDCAPDQVVECTGNQQAAATYPPTAEDVCDPTIDVGCAPGSGAIFPLGTHDVACTATDGSGNVGSCGLTVTVQDTTPPAITCPASQTVECTGDAQSQITFAASATDVCWGDTHTACAPASGASFPVGDTEVTCSSEDGSGNTGACDVTMTVEDTVPPEIVSVSATPDALWPPNHKMRRIEVDIQATDVCDPSPTCEVVGVASDEPDAGDIEIVGPTAVKLRAERDAQGDGRVYTITVECRDGTGGNATQATTEVHVYHDQRDSGSNDDGASDLKADKKKAKKKKKK
jgi:hypothetical protein